MRGMSFRGAWVVGSFVLLFAAAALWGQPAEHVIAIKAARLIDGTGAPAITNGVVVVRGEKIEAVGPAANITVPAGAEVIDLGNETIMPGMVNTHGHIFIRNRPEPAGGGYIQDAAKPKAEQMAVGIRHARLGLLSGTTTIRITSDNDFVDVYLKGMIDKGVVPGPRYVTGGVGMTSTGGHGFANWEVDGVENIRRFVRWNLQHGSEQQKLSMNDISPTETYWTREELKAAVDELHRHRRWVTVHASGVYGSSVQRVLEAGVDSVEHANPHKDEFNQLYLRATTHPDASAIRFPSYKGVGLSQTHIFGGAILQKPLGDPENYYWLADNKFNSTKELNDWVRASFAKWRKANPTQEHAINTPGRRNWPQLNWIVNDNNLNFDRPQTGGAVFIGENLGDLKESHTRRVEGIVDRAETLYRAFKAGVKVGVGLDGPYAEIPLMAEWLVNDGKFSPMDALLVVTRDGAVVAGVGDKVGTLEVGKLADVISVRGNPLDDITKLSEVNFIMVGGKRYQLSYH